MTTPRRTAWRVALVAIVFTSGGTLVGEQLWLSAKARLAGVLIERAFVNHLADGQQHQPWGWADTWPLARIEVPRLHVERVVLAGATGATLAFGPGHIDGTAAPGTIGNVAIAGHRDGAFAFLQELRAGDEMVLETRHGVERFRVERLEVRDMRDGHLLDPADRSLLTLVTCYPFGGVGALTRGPQRYVVTAERLIAPTR